LLDSLLQENSLPQRNAMDETKYCVLCQEEHAMTAKCIILNVKCKGCGRRGHLRKDCGVRGLEREWQRQSQDSSPVRKAAKLSPVYDHDTAVAISGSFVKDDLLNTATRVKQEGQEHHEYYECLEEKSFEVKEPTVSKQFEGAIDQTKKTGNKYDISKNDIENNTSVASVKNEGDYNVSEDRKEGQETKSQDLEKSQSQNQLNVTPVKLTVEKDKVTAECPYCTSVHKWRDELYEHVRRIHPGEELPDIVTMDEEDLSTSNMSSNAGGGSGAGMVRLMSAEKAKTGLGVQGKYRQKEYICPHCGEGYWSATKLEVHVDKTHEKDEGSNTVIAVRNNLCRAGFKVFKVLSIYSSRQRFRAARLEPLGQDKWMLTGNINNNVMRQDILKKLTSVKKDSGLFKIDPEELSSLTEIISEDRKSARGSRIIG